MSLKQRHQLAEQRAALDIQHNPTAKGTLEVLLALARADRPVKFNSKDIEAVGLVDGRKVSEDGAKLDKIEPGAQRVTPQAVSLALAGATEPLSTGGQRVNGREMAADGRKLDGIEPQAQRVTAERVLTVLADARAEFSALLTELAGRALDADTRRLEAVERQTDAQANALERVKDTMETLDGLHKALVAEIAATGAQPCSAQNVAVALSQSLAPLHTNGQLLNNRDMQEDGAKLDEIEERAQRCSSANVLSALAQNRAPIVLNGADLARVGSINGHSIDSLIARIAALEAKNG